MTHSLSLAAAPALAPALAFFGDNFWRLYFELQNSERQKILSNFAPQIVSIWCDREEKYLSHKVQI